MKNKDEIESILYSVEKWRHKLSKNQLDKIAKRIKFLNDTHIITQQSN